ncbi:hypothetical protein [Clostridium cylindrosporum]|nr:hypothetical protein [Clostridium cylindrosporum]
MNINIVLFVFNIIPVGFLDGGRILKEVLSMFISFYLANLIINLNGIIFGCIILMLPIYMGWAINSIILILISLSLIANSILQIKWIKMSIIQEALYKKFNKNFLNNKEKVKFYSEDTKIFDIMKNFSFNINYVIGIDKNKENTISDKEIIKFYFTKGNITLRECFD